MKSAGSFPVATIGDDLEVERELLEAPSTEPTLLGGYQGPCIDRPPERRRLTLAEQLDAWHAETWRAAA